MFQLYNAGARNFVFNPVLPVHLTPNTTNRVGANPNDCLTMVNTYQSSLNTLATQKRTKSGVTIIQPNNIATIIANIQKNPTTNTYSQYTNGYKVTTSYCQGNKDHPCYAPSPYAYSF
jgi:hypothetical protein